LLQVPYTARRIDPNDPIDLRQPRQLEVATATRHLTEAPRQDGEREAVDRWRFK
jgi:hypothetical protein